MLTYERCFVIVNTATGPDAFGLNPQTHWLASESGSQIPLLSHRFLNLSLIMDNLSPTLSLTETNAVVGHRLRCLYSCVHIALFLDAFIFNLVSE